MSNRKKTNNSIGVIYARYSSHKQREVSIEQQVEKCVEYAERHGIKLIRTYADQHTTGRSDRRPQFQEMMRDAALGVFNCVISWKSDRIGRNMLEAMINDSRLRELGVKCCYTEEDFGDSAAGRYSLRSMMNNNQFYSESLAENVVRGMEYNAKNLMVNGPLPFGLRNDGSGHIELDPPRSDIAREIFERVAARETIASILQDFEARGVKNQRGGPWKRAAMTDLLTNERMRGVYLFNDIRIENAIPRIVDDELFYKVRDIMTAKKPAKGRATKNTDYMLTGKLYCGKCGELMTGLSGTGRDGDMRFYYRCMGRYHKTCDQKSVRKDLIEDLITRSIKTELLTDEAIDWIADTTVMYNKRREKDAGADAIEEQLKENARAQENLMKVVELGHDISLVADRLEERRKEQGALERRLRKLRMEVLSPPRSAIVALLKDFQHGDIDDKEYRKELFELFLVRAEITDDNVKIFFSYGGDNAIEIKNADEAFEASSELPFQNVLNKAHLVSHFNAYSKQITFANGLFILSADLSELRPPRRNRKPS